MYIHVANIRNNSVLASTATSATEKWLLDTGATCGVTYDNKNMTDMQPSDHKIRIGNGAQIKILGQGTVILEYLNGTKMTLCDVNYAPAFAKHIISFRSLLEQKWKIQSATVTEFLILQQQSTIAFTHEPGNNLYYLHAKRVSNSSLTVANLMLKSPMTLDINVAHSILGHPDM